MPVSVPDLAPLTPGARRVLDAASELFYERGIHAVGVDTIAEAAGVTKKTLYDRFGSKEALVVAYLQHRDARWREHLADHLARVPAAGPDRDTPPRSESASAVRCWRSRVMTRPR